MRNEVFEADRIRYGGGSLLRSHALRFIWAFRQCQVSRNPIWRAIRCVMEDRYGLEIGPSVKIGKGLYLGHAFNITINPGVTIGENANIHKGVTIGQENRGARKGIPTIGSRVWIGVNATIVGKVTIGDNVLIAPGSYVNRDVPSNSIVLGNPCTIISSQAATDGYVNRMA